MKSGLLLILSLKQMVKQAKAPTGPNGCSSVVRVYAQDTEYPKFEH